MEAFRIPIMSPVIRYAPNKFCRQKDETPKNLINIFYEGRLVILEVKNYCFDNHQQFKTLNVKLIVLYVIRLILLQWFDVTLVFTRFLKNSHMNTMTTKHVLSYLLS